VNVTVDIEHLFLHDWAMVEWFADQKQVSELRAEAQALYARGQFRPASVGKGAERARRSNIRSDTTCWFAEKPMPAQRQLLQAFAQLRQQFNSKGYLGLMDVECHFARYDVGDRYARHFDRFQADDRRVVSAVLYLNDHWRAEDGGELALWPRGKDALLIPPRAGTLALFMSEHMEHEVLPAHRERWSVAAWFSRRSSGVLT
jgi:SM-20-related protein